MCINNIHIQCMYYKKNKTRQGTTPRQLKFGIGHRSFLYIRPVLVSEIEFFVHVQSRTVPELQEFVFSY